MSFILSLLFIGVGITIIGKSKINSENSQHEKYNIIKTPIIHRFKKYLRGDMIKAIAFCFMASLGWAIGAVIIEYATFRIDLIFYPEEMSSILGNVIRFPFAFLILSSMALREKFFKKGKEQSQNEKKKSLRTWSLLIIASIIGTSLGAYLYTESVHLAGANFVSLIASASPLFALPLTYILNKEKVSRYSFIGVILTIVGVVIIII
jgi:drug/metabolite transporter (DMT)-like permease